VPRLLSAGFGIVSTTCRRREELRLPSSTGHFLTNPATGIVNTTMSISFWSPALTPLGLVSFSFASVPGSRSQLLLSYAASHGIVRYWRLLPVLSTRSFRLLPPRDSLQIGLGLVVCLLRFPSSQPSFHGRSVQQGFQFALRRSVGSLTACFRSINLLHTEGSTLVSAWFFCAVAHESRHYLFSFYSFTGTVRASYRSRFGVSVAPLSALGLTSRAAARLLCLC